MVDSRRRPAVGGRTFRLGGSIARVTESETEIEVPTPHGPARVHLRPRAAARGALVLGHGAGGGVGSGDLQASSEAALAAGYAVALVEQPYRVAGRRAPAPAAQLDRAWTAVIDHLRGGELAGLRLVFGGRSMGARVACRTAGPAGAAGVVCLAFPLLPPRRKSATGQGKEPQSRLSELEAVPVPILIVQGLRDQFGMPPPGPGRDVVQVTGDHSLRSDLPAVGEAVGAWLAALPA